VIRYFLGGEIVLAEQVQKTDPVARHAWSRLPGGTDLDLTREQFPEDQKFLECQIDEAIIDAVSGRQARLLLGRVRERLDDELQGEEDVAG